MAATHKLIAKVTYILVTSDGGKETRQQMKKVDYEYKNFDRTAFPTLLAQAAATLDH